MQEKLEALKKESLQQIKSTKDESILRDLEVKFLGKKSELHLLSRKI